MSHFERMRLALPILVAAALVPSFAHAFCGFYVSGAGADLYNDATQVVLMRAGTRTVLSMQNNYKGPPEQFAMVVPVPVVLQEENVKTLDKAIFKRVDQLAAPRLVEYWEQDPCRPIRPSAVPDMARAPVAKSGGRASSRELGVVVEAQFTVGEYEIVILSAKDSTGLDTWLRKERYQIPSGAEPLLRPYVESGSKFFVAKVDTSKVAFKDGMAMLSPLRFHYESEAFSLPIRLGMINSAGTQDLLVHILAPGQRYEVANYKNALIPTNLQVKDEVRQRFGEFYAALLDRTLEKNPGAVVTEYSWDASTCDPCPTPRAQPRGAGHPRRGCALRVVGGAQTRQESRAEARARQSHRHSRRIRPHPSARSLQQGKYCRGSGLHGRRAGEWRNRYAQSGRHPEPGDPTEWQQHVPGPLCDPASLGQAAEL